LLLGPRTWPGLRPGSFVLNAALLSELASPEVARPLLVAAGIESGSAAQPLLGAWLLRRSIGARDPPARTADAPLGTDPSRIVDRSHPSVLSFAQRPQAPTKVAH
jgi:hypothetical protein